MKSYDFLIVGAGLFGATFAYKAKQRGLRCLVIDKRNHAGGNVYCKNEHGINIHYYGAHIFHTNDKPVWDFVNRFASFNRYTNSPVANYKGELYNLPFNMNTFYKLWKVTTPQQAQDKINEQIESLKISHPRNLEEQALKLVGTDIYEKLIKGYTEKQWGRKACDLPSFIIKRLPVRFTFDNNYFNDLYQGIPIGGYNKIIDGLLDGVEVKLNTNYLADRDYFNSLADKIVYTGPIDEYFEYRFGTLEYRSLRFEHEHLDVPNFQGNAVVNYTDAAVPYTRIIEHKHFEFGTQPTTIISREYSAEWKPGMEQYYPVNNEENNNRFIRYQQLSSLTNNVIFGGRLAEYKYYDMHQVIASALMKTKKLFGAMAQA
ncbi:UDP-galactopyranose mutase [Ferruginibacter paludis]|uniref:UDP-galactopyranose mutase n=1 Tax=Ferruginibacter paludis TaxID=1310417 RepID=UPI0025B543D7|nr:UDP-galactopyranose mutase [Ferruginibacter paludis]MDN3656159.1 UDP-galactopyranose mutase [Ferruginibacter paludis]